ncbi:B-cell receptor-associated protein 31-like [Neltuma alba]|uniref:B-cell receptor-associated protein 31-like n=1 Tax=Neltuma alba TaxID=207710 RepID=UPI0010A2C12E|nr:B-cell receptor-associated protein 31-like [Prosopis alba]
MLVPVFSVIAGELTVILLLLFKTPLRQVVIMSLDRLKQGRGPVVVKTVDGTLFVLFASSLYNVVSIHQRSVSDSTAVNPTDQFLMYKHLLEASAIGFALCLSLMIDRFHNYIRELRTLRNSMEAAKKQIRSVQDGKNVSTEEEKPLVEEVAVLRPKVKQLESECEVKDGKAKALEVEVESLKKQSEGLLVEYNKLLADNQNLRSQLEA